jgi:hypothetical protein
MVRVLPIQLLVISTFIFSGQLMDYLYRGHKSYIAPIHPDNSSILQILSYFLRMSLVVCTSPLET